MLTGESPLMLNNTNANI